MKPKPFIALKNLTVPLAFSPVSWRCGPPRSAARSHRHRLAFDPKVRRRNSPAAIDERELERLAVREVGQTRLLDRRDMDEYVLSAIVANDEAETLLRVEEFDDALAFANDLRGHSATAAAAAAETAAAAAAAAAITAAAAAAEAATIAKAAAAAATAAISTAAAEAAAVTIAAATAAAVAAAFLAPPNSKLLFAETFALVATASAAIAFAPSIETHNRPNLKEPAYP